MSRALCSMILLAGVAAAHAGCHSSPPPAKSKGGPIPVLDVDSAKAAGFSLQQAREAVGLYTAKCVRCHKSYDPAGYTDAQWSKWMSKMSRKAKLTPTQEAELTQYLEAFRAAAKPEERKSK